MRMFSSLTLIATLAGSTAIAGATVTYDVDGQPFEGYFAPAVDAPRGTVVILPTWKGLSEYEKDRADMLAAMGYAAFAADIHGQGKLPKSMDEMQSAYEAFFADMDREHAILRAAVETGESLGTTDVIVMGYSMGGGATMELTRSGLGAELGVDGYAIFSGRVSDPMGREIPDGTAPIFVAHGEKDERVPASSLINFQNNLDFTDVEYEVTVYPGVGHLFSAFGFPNYDAEADKASWAAFTAFLEKTLD